MENLDLTKVLRDCPRGTKLYSPIFGEVTYKGITNGSAFPIIVQRNDNTAAIFATDGRYWRSEDSECLLFPSKYNRDWSTFKPKQSEPQFESKQWVLVRNDDNIWELQIYSHYRMDHPYPHCCLGGTFKDCIPYEGNEELCGTANGPKEGL